MTDRYAVIGNPIAHSKSPFIHAEFARQTNQDLEYGALLSPLDQFTATVGHFVAQGGKGLNVTVPFKQEAFCYAKNLSDRAAMAQAVNTLSFIDGKIYGDNTDGVGLIRDVIENLGGKIHEKRVLVMGAGGAARGILLPLLEQEPATLFIVNRTLEKAQKLVTMFNSFGRVAAVSYQEIPATPFDLIINATSSSLTDDIPPLPEHIFAENCLAYDLMYAKHVTPFLAFAKQHGASQVADGIGMLVEQAAESFFIWRGVRPQTAPVITALKELLMSGAAR